MLCDGLCHVLAFAPPSGNLQIYLQNEPANSLHDEPENFLHSEPANVSVATHMSFIPPSRRCIVTQVLINEITSSISVV